MAKTMINQWWDGSTPQPLRVGEWYVRQRCRTAPEWHMPSDFTMKSAVQTMGEEIAEPSQKDLGSTMRFHAST